jgi:uncharacterized membrane protein YgcG
MGVACTLPIPNPLTTPLPHVPSHPAHAIVFLFPPKAVHYIITGLYPTSDKDAVALAAMQFQAKFGKFNQALHRPGFLTRNLVEYIPGEYLQDAKNGKTAEQWEQLLFHKIAYTVTNTPREAYLDYLKKRDYYGSSFFVVRQKFDSKSLPKTLYLAVSRKGILLLRVPATYLDGDLEVLYSFKLAEVYRWAYKPSVNFYFEVKLGDSMGGDSNPVYTFDTAEGKAISDLLTDYAMALLREMGLNPDGTRRVRPKDAKAAAEAAAAAAAAAAGASGSGGGGGGGGGGSGGGGSGSGSGSSGGAAASAAPLPVRSAMANSADAYKGLEGVTGSLASAATRSGEYQSGGGGGGGAGGAPPPPPTFAPPPPPPPPPAAPALPPNWTKVLDEGSGQHYYFNTLTGASVWDESEMT